MAKTTTLTVRVDQSTKDRLDAAAKETQRSKSFLAAQAIEEYLAVQEWQKARVREALSSAERGEVIAHQDVMKWIDSWGADEELPKPKP